MGCPMQKGFFLPVRGRVRRVSDDGALRVAPANPLNGPDALHTHQIDIQDAGTDDSVHQKRFGLIRRHPMDDAIFFRAQRRANRLDKIRVRRQNQNRFH